MNTATSIRPSRLSERAAAAATALILGLLLIFAVGFGPSTVLHNAAHDSRHGLAFPCH